MSEERRDQALRLATAGVALDDSPATRSSLLSALVRNSPALGVLNEPDSIYSAALSPDGRTLATDHGTFFDTQTRERIGEYRARRRRLARLRSPGRLARDRRGPWTKLGYLHVFDAATGRRRSSARLGGYPADPGKPIWPTATYAPDGRSVIVQYARVSGPAAEAHVFLRRFDPRTGSPIGPAVRVAARWNQARPSPPSMTQDGRLFIAEDEVTREGGDLRDRRGLAARRAPLSGRRFHHRCQPRRRHARARPDGRPGSPARPRLRSGADHDRRAPRRSPGRLADRRRTGGRSGPRPSAPTGARSRPATGRET